MRKGAAMGGAWSVLVFRSLLSILAMLVVATATPRAGHADGPGFVCPHDGLSVEGMWTETRVKFVTWYDGANPNDPAMCYVRYMPLGPNGERVHMIRIYNVFSLQTLATNSLNYETHKLLDTDDMRRKMDALLSGQADKANFTVTISINGATPFYIDQAWQRLDNETLTIGDRQINAMVFRCWSERNNWPGVHSGRRNVTRRWLDPSTGVWIKELIEETVGSGTVQDYVVLRISDTQLPPETGNGGD
jgi:hypothetical protein